MHDGVAELRDLVEHHARMTPRGDVVHGLRLHRATAPDPRINTIYRPSLCLVLQGGKRVLLGDRVVDYDHSQYLIVGVDLPVTGCIVQACSRRPYLGLSLDLDPALVADLLLVDGGGDREAAPGPALAVGQLDRDLYDTVLRLVRLLERPDESPVMAPVIRREIHYRLLRGEQGAMLRDVATADSRLARIGQVIEWIRQHHAERFHVDELARRASMSATSFHRHFKAVTSMSPLQYRTRVRLQQARRLLLLQPGDVAGIGFRVGYGNPSQFSREYRRLFGLPPAADAERIRDGRADVTAG